MRGATIICQMLVNLVVIKGECFSSLLLIASIEYCALALCRLIYCSNVSAVSLLLLCHDLAARTPRICGRVIFMTSATCELWRE